MVGIAGRELNSIERAMLSHPWVGGVVLFARNYASPKQLRGLTDEIHRIREPSLVVAVDQEGGTVQRFRAGFSELPDARDIGYAYDKDPALGRELARAVGETLGAELEEAGIDINFAPVLDLDCGNEAIIGARALHREPRVVGQLGQELLRGMQAFGVHGVAKHYPGHGSAPGDTHVHETWDMRPLKTFRTSDFLAYRSLIDAGLEAVMSSHVIYPKVSDDPASFSTFWLRDVLRLELRFRGLVFSDDLSMGAARPSKPLEQRVLGVLAAGCDVALVCNELELIPSVLAALGTSPPIPELERLARRSVTMRPPRAGLVDVMARAVRGRR